MEDEIIFAESASRVVREIIYSIISTCENEKSVYNAEETLNFILDRVDAIDISDKQIYDEIYEIVKGLLRSCSRGESSQQIRTEVKTLLNELNETVERKTSNGENDSISISSECWENDPTHASNEVAAIYPNEAKSEETLSAKIVAYSLTDSSQSYTEKDEVDIATANENDFSQSDIEDDTGITSNTVSDANIESESETECETETGTEIESEYDGNVNIIVTLKDSVRGVICTVDRLYSGKNLREQLSGEENAYGENKLATCSVSTDGGDQLLPDSYNIARNSVAESNYNVEEAMDDDGVVPTLDADVDFKMESTDEHLYEASQNPMIISEGLECSKGGDGKARSLRLGLSRKQNIKPLHNYSFKPKN